MPSIGILLLISGAVAFFAAMTFGSKPYYWPNTETKDFGSTPPLSIRSGWMALALVPFMLSLGMRSNLISYFVGRSQDRLQVIDSHAVLEQKLTKMV